MTDPVVLQLRRWFKDLGSLRSPSQRQITETWQVAQALHGRLYPNDQQRLDDCRRDVVAHILKHPHVVRLSRPRKSDSRFLMAPVQRPIKAWHEIELTPELSWSPGFVGYTVPAPLVKALRAALGRQRVNLR